MAGIDDDIVNEALGAFEESAGDAVQVPAVAEGGGDGAAEENQKQHKKLTREEAKALVMVDYDSFGDVVASNAVDTSRLAEYMSKIVFWYTDTVSGEEKSGFLRKYPKFLELFGGEAPSVGEVLRKFAPEVYDMMMEEDTQADCKAKALAEIIEKDPFNLQRPLDGKDREILEMNGVKEPEKYRCVSDLMGMSEDLLTGYDETSNAVYLDGYAGAVADASGVAIEGGNIEVMSMDDVMRDVDMDVFNRMCGRKNPGAPGGGPVQIDVTEG